MLLSTILVEEFPRMNRLGKKLALRPKPGTLSGRPIPRVRLQNPTSEFTWEADLSKTDHFRLDRCLALGYHDISALRSLFETFAPAGRHG